MSVERHPTVSEAFTAVPRARFLPENERGRAGSNVPLGIGHGQTNSQPSTVADMLTLLDPQPGDQILDLGSGSGWTTALLAVLVGDHGRVVGVERHGELLDRARAAVEGFDTDTEVDPGSGAAENPHAPIEFIESTPGVLGAPDRGPFDRILVSAGADHLPDELVAQLSIGGVMVIPVDGEMLRVERAGSSVEHVNISRHGLYRFVPLIVE